MTAVCSKDKWKSPIFGSRQRVWFVLNPTSKYNVPSLSYYEDDRELTLKVINCRARTCVSTCRVGGLVALSHHRDVCRISCQGTLYLNATWTVQHGKISSGIFSTKQSKKLMIEFFSDRQRLLVQADNVEECNAWIKHLELTLRRLKWASRHR